MKDFAIDLLEENGGEMKLVDLQKALMETYSLTLRQATDFTRKLRTDGVVSYYRDKKSYRVVLEKQRPEVVIEEKEDTVREEAVKWLYQESGVFEGKEIVIDHTGGKKDGLGKMKWSLLIALAQQGKLEQVFREPLEEL